MKRNLHAELFLFVLVALALAGCSQRTPTPLQGYIEGEFVYIAAPLAGRLDNLSVERGARVEAGSLLFTLERDAELATHSQAASQLNAAQSTLDDLRKGQRPSELAALEAQLGQAQSAAELSRLELARQEALFKSQTISINDYDHARLAADQNAHAVDELVAQLATARLGGRADMITAAEANVHAASAAKEKADWSVAQKSQSAPAAALVYDTLYRKGEFVAAGNPVVSLLPPANIKVRFFVPESAFASLKASERVRVAFDGRDALDARISYNRDNRSKLVFMVEAVFADANAARDLHPGQPVDVTLLK